MKTKKMSLLFYKLMPVGLLLSIAGCAPVISKQIRDQVRPETTFSEVMKNPEHYQGQMIVLSGIIVAAENTKEGTLLQILQRPAGFRGRPKDVDKTEGRFLALDSRYLDTYVYTKGREITVAGEIMGKRTLPLNKIEYTYPLIHVKELYLWQVIKDSDYISYPYPYSYFYYDNYWWWRTHFIDRERCHRRSKK
ncbi:MAG: Slp family lipoprotein [Candidatus Brocadiaceae bacterium]|nr:Slp family lipoprotein [Candidatus Brocadiaceae bacterium]